jgi:hypothetical protein
MTSETEIYIKQISKAINLLEKILRKIDFSHSDKKSTVELIDNVKIYTTAIRGYIAEKPKELSLPNIEPLFLEISDGTWQLLKFTNNMEIGLDISGIDGIHFSWASAIKFVQGWQTLISDIDTILPELIR